MNQQLEREEDCHEEPATRENTPIAIVEEEESYEDLHVATTTSGYSKVGFKNKQGLLDWPKLTQDAVEFAAIYRDTDKEFVRTMASAKQRRSLEVQHPSTGTIGPARSPGTFQPPALCQDCV